MKARRLRHRMGGVAAVEMALILCLGFFIIPVVLLFGRILWTYEVLKQSTYAAAAIYGSVPLSTILDDTATASLDTIAQGTVSDALGNAGTAPLQLSSSTTVQCTQCRWVPGATVTVATDYDLPPILPNWVLSYMDGAQQTGVHLSVQTNVTYAIRPLTP